MSHCDVVFLIMCPVLRACLYVQVYYDCRRTQPRGPKILQLDTLTYMSSSILKLMVADIFFKLMPARDGSCVGKPSILCSPSLYLSGLPSSSQKSFLKKSTRIPKNDFKLKFNCMLFGISVFQIERYISQERELSRFDWQCFTGLKWLQKKNMNTNQGL